MANVKTISFDVNTVDTAQDADSLPDHITFQVTQTSDQSVSVKTLIDISQDGFGTLSSNTTETFPMGTTPDWRLSSLKFENQKLLLLGQNGATAKSIAFDQLTSVDQSSKVAMQPQQLDKKIIEDAGVLAALRDDSTLDAALGTTGLNADTMSGIGGLINTRGTNIGSGGLGARGSGFSGGGTAEGLGGLGTRGRGSGASGYASGGGSFGTRSVGGTGTVDGDPIILGALDKSLIDAVIKRNMAQIRYAYQRELTKNPTLAGKITVKFTIVKDGSVTGATIKSNEMALSQDKELSEAGKRVGQAICGRFLRFQFPEPQGGGIVIVSYPFIFSPG